MSFRIRALPRAPFEPLFALDEAALIARGARRVVADAAPGFPCRVSVEDAEPGETVLLLNYTHQPADTPFRASHAIFVREKELETFTAVDEIPAAMRARTMSLRAFDDAGMMIAAEVAPGQELEAAIERLFAAPGAAYIHAHYAGMGCYAARIDRG